MNNQLLLTLIIGSGVFLVLFNRPWARFLAARRRLNPHQARVLRANLLYNGLASALAGLLFAAGRVSGHPLLSLAGVALVASVPVLSLALAPITEGWLKGPGAPRR